MGIFADTEGAEKLVELIKESHEGKVPIGDFQYKISKGAEDTSLVSTQRFPLDLKMMEEKWVFRKFYIINTRKRY